MYEDQTQEVILDRMLSTFPDDVDTRQGAVPWDMTSPVSIEMAMIYIQLDLILNWGFASTSSGEWLTLRANEVGVNRKGAVPAVGTVMLVTESPNLTVPVGTVVGVDGGQQYTTDYAITLVTSVPQSVTVTAIEGGTLGNIQPLEINVVVGDLIGVVSASNTDAFTGGLDEESDEDLYTRYNVRMTNGLASGAPSDYLLWAMSVEGVGGARVFRANPSIVEPNVGGGGWVRVVIMGANRRTAPAPIVEAARDYILPKVPVGASLDISGVTEQPITVRAVLTLSDIRNFNTIYATVSRNISTYLRGLAMSDYVVRYNRIGDCFLHVPGIIDFSGLTVNGGTTNLQIPDDSIAVMSELYLTTN